MNIFNSHNLCNDIKIVDQSIECLRVANQNVSLPVAFDL